MEVLWRQPCYPDIWHSDVLKCWSTCCGFVVYDSCVMCMMTDVLVDCFLWPSHLIFTINKVNPYCTKNFAIIRLNTPVFDAPTCTCHSLSKIYAQQLPNFCLIWHFRNQVNEIDENQIKDEFVQRIWCLHAKGPSAGIMSQITRFLCQQPYMCT